MSITNKKGINVTSGFTLFTSTPLDQRQLVSNLTELQSIIDTGSAYKGLLVWVETEGCYYYYNGSKFLNLNEEQIKLVPLSVVIDINNINDVDYYSSIKEQYDNGKIVRAVLIDDDTSYEVKKAIFVNDYIQLEASHVVYTADSITNYTKIVILYADKEKNIYKDIKASSSSATLSYVDKKAEDIAKIAEGKTKALVFDDYELLVQQLNNEDNPVSKIGDPFYVVKLNVPDLWVSNVNEDFTEYTYTNDEDLINQLIENQYIDIGWYRLSLLETQKAEIETGINYLDVVPDEDGTGFEFTLTTEQFEELKTNKDGVHLKMIDEENIFDIFLTKVFIWSQGDSTIIYLFGSILGEFAIVTCSPNVQCEGDLISIPEFGQCVLDFNTIDGAINLQVKLNEKYSEPSTYTIYSRKIKVNGVEKEIIGESSYEGNPIIINTPNAYLIDVDKTSLSENDPEFTYERFQEYDHIAVYSGTGNVEIIGDPLLSCVKAADGEKVYELQFYDSDNNKLLVYKLIITDDNNYTFTIEEANISGGDSTKIINGTVSLENINSSSGVLTLEDFIFPITFDDNNFESFTENTIINVNIPDANMLNVRHYLTGNQIINNMSLLTYSASEDVKYSNNSSIEHNSIVVVMAQNGEIIGSYFALTAGKRNFDYSYVQKEKYTSLNLNNNTMFGNIPFVTMKFRNLLINDESKTIVGNQEVPINTHIVHDFSSLTITTDSILNFSYPSGITYDSIREIDSVKFKLTDDAASSSILTLEYYGKNDTQKIFYKLIPTSSSNKARIIFIFFSSDSIICMQHVAWLGSVYTQITWSTTATNKDWEDNYNGIYIEDPDEHGRLIFIPLSEEISGTEDIIPGLLYETSIYNETTNKTTYWKVRTYNTSKQYVCEKIEKDGNPSSYIKDVTLKTESNANTLQLTQVTNDVQTNTILSVLNKIKLNGVEKTLSSASVNFTGDDINVETRLIHDFTSFTLSLNLPDPDFNEISRSYPDGISFSDLRSIDGVKFKLSDGINKWDVVFDYYGLDSSTGRKIYQKVLGIKDKTIILLTAFFSSEKILFEKTTKDIGVTAASVDWSEENVLLNWDARHGVAFTTDPDTKESIYLVLDSVTGYHVQYTSVRRYVTDENVELVYYFINANLSDNTYRCGKITEYNDRIIIDINNVNDVDYYSLITNVKNTVNKFSVEFQDSNVRYKVQKMVFNDDSIVLSYEYTTYNPDFVNHYTKQVTLYEDKSQNTFKEVAPSSFAVTSSFVNKKVTDVLNIAEGKTKSYVYEDYATMVETLNTETTAKSKVGDTIYIVDINVPDLWVSRVNDTITNYTFVDNDTLKSDIEEQGYIDIGWYRLSLLETQKAVISNSGDFIDVIPTQQQPITFNLTTEQFEKLKTSAGVHLTLNISTVVYDLFLHKGFVGTVNDGSTTQEMIVLYLLGLEPKEISYFMCAPNTDTVINTVVIPSITSYIQDMSIGTQENYYYINYTKTEQVGSEPESTAYNINLRHFIINGVKTWIHGTTLLPIDTHLVHDFTSLTIPAHTSYSEISQGMFAYPDGITYDSIREIDSVKFKLEGDLASSTILTLEYYGKNDTQKIFYKLIPNVQYMARVIYIIFTSSAILYQQQNIPLIDTSYAGRHIEWSNEEKEIEFTIPMFYGIMTNDPDTNSIIYMKGVNVEILGDDFGDDRGGYYSSLTVYDVYNDQNIHYTFRWYNVTGTYKFTKTIEKIDDKIKNYLDNNLENGNTGEY